jgi:DNA-directed RNA polymerase subunit RPC12/RpoP
MRKRFWRCFACEKNFYDDDMKGPILYYDKSEEYYVCFNCACDLGVRNTEQKKYLLLECPKCQRPFLPLLDFDTSQYHSKVLPCPYCKERCTYKFSLKPDGPVVVEMTPEAFNAFVRKK